MTLTPTQSLLAWYHANKRSMPWRDVRDPYRVWVSEIMLQQTQVDTVRPYYDRWLAKFPSVSALATASLDDVLLAWEGLGYYSRARKMHQCAQVLMAKHDGVMPQDLELLLTLPGIGPYTAAAIASFSYGIDALTLDGNLSRVLARFAGIDLLYGTRDFQQAVREAGMALLPPGQSADFNQALMDLGAMVCTPSTPKCDACPLSNWCKSMSAPTNRPIKPTKPEVPTKYKVALVAVQNGKVLLARRPENGLLGGMWEFPAVEVDDLDGLNDIEVTAKLAQEYAIDAIILRVAITVKHAYTHFKVLEQAWYGKVSLSSTIGIATWQPLESLSTLAMGKIDRAIAAHVRY